MAEMLRKEIQDLLMNQDFTKGLLELEDESKVKEYFLEHGNVELTDDEVNQVKQSVKGVMDKVATLPEAELNKIAGGEVDHNPVPKEQIMAAFNHYVNRQAPQVDAPTAAPAAPATPASSPTVPATLEAPTASEAKKGIPTWEKVAIGSAAVAAVAGIGAGVYRLGRKKGWWGK